MNPYQSPSSFDASPVSITPGRRPGGLTAICVIAMIFGGLGAVSSMFSLGNLVMRSYLKSAFDVRQQPGMSKEFVEAQRDMQKKTDAVTDRYLGFFWVSTPVNLFLGTSLFIGGILVLQFKPKGRTFLAAVFVATILFEIARTPVHVYMQREVVTVMSNSMPRMMNAIPAKDGSNAAVAEGMATMMKVGTLAMIVFMVAFGLAKVIFYAIGVRYLGRPQIRRLFPPAALPAM
jgi:hypothetical protein